MANEKYINHYVDILTGTLTDTILKSVSMQANARITDEVIKEQTEKIEKLTTSLNQKQEQVNQLNSQKASNENTVINDLNTRILQKDSELNRLLNELNELKSKYRDYDSIKNQATHVDTFKNELIKTREEVNKVRDEYEKKIVSLQKENDDKVNVIKKNHESEKQDLTQKINELTTKIDYLQLPPAKRKKIDELNKEVTTPVISNVLVGTNSLVEDGGTF
jgi:chromosome segregation ATPase